MNIFEDKKELERKHKLEKLIIEIFSLSTLIWVPIIAIWLAIKLKSFLIGVL